MNTSKKRRKTSSSTVVTSPEATTAVTETEIPSSSTVVTTPESKSMVTETEEQDITNLVPADLSEPQPSTPGESVQHENVEPSLDELGTPSSASLVVENCSASTPASFVVDPCSGNSFTSGASVVSTPLSTTYSCKDCTRMAKKSHNLQRSNSRLKTKVHSLKEEVSSLRHTITELESASFIDLCLVTIDVYVVHLYLFNPPVALEILNCISNHWLAHTLVHIFSPSQENYDLQIFPFVLFQFSIYQKGKLRQKMKQNSRKVPDKNPSIQQTIMFGLVLGMKPRMRVTTEMMSGAQEGKALKMKVLLRMRKKCRKIKITSSKSKFLYIIIC